MECDAAVPGAGAPGWPVVNCCVVIEVRETGGADAKGRSAIMPSAVSAELRAHEIIRLEGDRANMLAGTKVPPPALPGQH
jgi:hypothetical protein